MSNNKKIAAVFPGQGSQKVGMGLDFYNNSEITKELFHKADKILGFSLSKIILEGPEEELTLTSHVQPAILLLSYACFLESEIVPVVGAGHSLGEYSALVASSSLSFEDAVQLVHKRGKYMQEAVKPGEGAMYAVMGMSYEDVKEVTDSVDDGVVEIANYNSPSQVVIAGDIKGTSAAAKLFGEKSAKVIELNVSAPFHCSLMKEAEVKLSRDLDNISFSEFNFPIYSNVEARVIENPCEAKEHLKTQVCSTVKWSEIITNIASEYSPNLFIEFGNGKVLSGLNKRIDRSLKSFSIGDRDSLTAAKVAVNE